MLFLKRNFVTRVKAKLNKDVLKSISNDEYKPRKHPGVTQSKTVTLPKNFISAAEIVLADFPVKSLFNSAHEMNNYLKTRIPPSEDEDVKRQMAKAEEDVLKKIGNVQIKSDNHEERMKQSINDRSKNLLKSRLSNWSAIKYDIHNSLLYLLARSAQEYGVLFRVMNEISLRDPEFKPRSLFDFGSGVGTGMWAAISFWKKHIFEYFNVDISRDMNDLAQTLLQGGSTTGKMEIRGVFYRQFLPATANAYDLVICSYSLLELPSAKSRMETILNLWNKTATYLIVVEHGNKAGFKVINEIRDFILQLNDGNCGGYVFSPCPHDHICPKFVSDKERKCYFPNKYQAFSFTESKEVQQELYSYVVFKKGERKKESLNWPRLVEPTLVRSKHCICRMCASDGQLKEMVFSTSKYGKPLYYCARKTTWGNLLPITILDDEEIKLDQNRIETDDSIT